jgi:hypothetical protein
MVATVPSLPQRPDLRVESGQEVEKRAVTENSLVLSALQREITDAAHERVPFHSPKFLSANSPPHSIGLGQ